MSGPRGLAAALALLAEAPARRRLAVLGGMAELGSMEGPGHAEVGALAARTADLVVTYGALAGLTAAAARAAGAPVIETTTRAEVVALLRGELREGDVALVKGSRGLAMEEIVADLAADGAGETEES